MTEIAKFDPIAMKSDSVLTPLGPVECRFLMINDRDLHGELDRNASDLAYFSGWESTAEWAVKNAAQELEEAETLAWMGLKARRDGGEKFTADDMKASVRADPRVRALKRELTLKEVDLAQFKTVRTALWRKGDLLQTKVHLRRSEMNREVSIAATSGAYRNAEKEANRNDDRSN